MKFRLKTSIPILVALTCAGLSHPANAVDSNAYVYIAHAAAGRNISSTTNPEYPVDIAMGGHCVAQGLSFGEIRGPFTQPAGNYTVRMSVANAVNPCGGAAVFSATVALAAGSTSMGMIEVNSAHQVMGQLLAVDLSAVPVGRGRLIVANVSPNNLTGVLTVGDSNSSPISQNFAAGTVTEVLPGGGEYSATVYPEGSSTAASGPIELNLVSRNVYLVVLAGSTSNGSVQIIGPQVIRGVF